MKLFVTGCGYGRCGTTWMQSYLSSLPGVRISGQPTCLPLDAIRKFLNGIHGASIAANNVNASLGQPRHHISVQPEVATAEVRKLVEAIWFDSDADIVGAKLNEQTPEDQMLRLLWPDAKFVACIRHPRSCFESLVGTYRPHLHWNVFIKRWVAAVNASRGRGNTRLFRIDRDGRQELSGIRNWLGVDSTPEADALIGRPVHARNHLPEPWRYEYPDAALRLMEQLGYGR